MTTWVVHEDAGYAAEDGDGHDGHDEHDGHAGHGHHEISSDGSEIDDSTEFRPAH